MKARRRRKGHEGLVEERTPTQGKASGLAPKELRQAYASVVAMHPFFKIAYFLPHPHQDLRAASPFCWYTPGMHSAAGPIFLAAQLPADIREAHTDTSYVLLHRLLRTIWPLVFPIELGSLRVLQKIVGTPFQVVITSDRDVADSIDKIIGESPIPVLHASLVPGSTRVPFLDMNTDRICAYASLVLDKLPRTGEWGDLAQQAKQVMRESPRRKLRKHSLPLGLHNVVAPNEIALTAFGWKLRSASRISMPRMPAGTDPQRYVDRICQSADAVFCERDRLLGEEGRHLSDYRYILAVPSLYWGHYKEWRAKIQTAPKAIRRKLKSAYSSAVQATTYFDQVELDDDGEPEDLYLALVGWRRQDMRSFTSALAFLAAASLAPVLRLETKLNRVRGELGVFAHCVRHGGKVRLAWKSSRVIRRLGAYMRTLINPSFLERIDAPEPDDQIEGMKLVSDLPLELLPTRGLSLALRYDCSRIPTVPGNLFIGECLCPPVVLPLRAFDEVLVLRSFEPNDQLRPLFQRAIEVISESQEITRVRYRFVDVKSSKDVVDAINNYEGGVLVFDCHGRYDPEIGAGALVIGGSTVNLWDLRHLCELPPIVMFSACDTQPIDGSHSSTATAAFALGARAILAAMFPIYGDQAAVFNARMLFRLEMFVSESLNLYPRITWREVVSGMLRMVHMTEVLQKLCKHAGLGITQAERDSVQWIANVAINNRRANWYEASLNRLSEVSGRSVGWLENEIQRWAGLTDAMKYVHLGNPESVIIVREHPAESLERAA